MGKHLNRQQGKLNSSSAQTSGSTLPQFSQPPHGNTGSFYWQAGSSLDVGGRSLRRTAQRERRQTVVSTREPSSLPGTNDSSRPLRSKRNNQPPNTTSTMNFSYPWTSEGNAPHPWGTLPMSEEEFLEDMLSDCPRFPSRAQQQPLEHWARAAVQLPDYGGPWKPSLAPASPSASPTASSSTSEYFDFYN